MSMTRRDYVLLSETISKCRQGIIESYGERDNPEELALELAVVEEMTEHIADALAGANHRFDHGRFVDASLTDKSS